MLKSRGVKGISTLSKQELIDKCMELKLLNTVLVASVPTETKKRKAEKISSSSVAARTSLSLCPNITFKALITGRYIKRQ